MKAAPALLSMLLAAAGLRAGDFNGASPDLVKGARALVQLRHRVLEKGPLADALDAALKRKAKVKVLVSESSEALESLKARGAQVRFASMAVSETPRMVVDAKVAMLEGCRIEADASRAAGLSVSFEGSWKKASENEARQWEKEYRSLPDPRQLEERSPRLKTRRRKA